MSAYRKRKRQSETEDQRNERLTTVFYEVENSDKLRCSANGHGDLLIALMEKVKNVVELSSWFTAEHRTPEWLNSVFSNSIFKVGDLFYLYGIRDTASMIVDLFAIKKMAWNRYLKRAENMAYYDFNCMVPSILERPAVRALNLAGATVLAGEQLYLLDELLLKRECEKMEKIAEKKRCLMSGELTVDEQEAQEKKREEERSEKEKLEDKIFGTMKAKTTPFCMCWDCEDGSCIACQMAEMFERGRVQGQRDSV